MVILRHSTTFYLSGRIGSANTRAFTDWHEASGLQSVGYIISSSGSNPRTIE